MRMDWESLTEATSGAVGALVSTTVLYPLDTCKSKYQAEVRSLDADGHGRPPKYRSGNAYVLPGPGRRMGYAHQNRADILFSSSVYTNREIKVLLEKIMQHL